MSLPLFYIRHWYYLLALCWLLSSCASYNKQANSYYVHLRQGNFEKASQSLDHIKLLKKDRNRLLYLLEKGKLAHLQRQWEISNQLLNEADLRMEDARTTAKDVALGNLLNPMMQTYKAEDFEKYLVHYYKALNYIQLNQPDEALVEARRISLRTYAQQDKTGNKNKYDQDAFSLMLQGLIYEKTGDINNAFIAYRNAADVYLNNGGSYYGITMPPQLKADLLRSAEQNGFEDERQRYANLLQIPATPTARSDGGELVLFWENGAAPVKEQQDLWFSLFKNAGGQFFFTDAAGMYNVPFDFSSGYSSDNIRLNDLRSFRVALPKYREQPPVYSRAIALVNGASYKMEPAENVNTLAFSTLKERMLRELSGTLTRLAIKKLAEAAVRPSEKKDDGKKTAEEKKKEKKQENTREAIALGLQLFNFASEKADTRNWQSLPHTIYYTRIPLAKGTNTITLQLEGQQQKRIEFTVEGNGSLQIRNEVTL